MGTGEQFTGKTRSAQRPIWDSFKVAGAAALNTNATTALFTSNQVNKSGVTGDVCNMRQAGSLPAGHRHMVTAIRIEMLSTTLADLFAMLQFTWIRFLYSGTPVWEATLSYAAGGMGIVGGDSNGVADPRAILYFDLQPIKIEGTVPIELDVITAGTGNATTAFFMRAYLDGVYTEPT